MLKRIQRSLFGEKPSQEIKHSINSVELQHVKPFCESRTDIRQEMLRKEFMREDNLIRRLWQVYKKCIERKQTGLAQIKKEYVFGKITDVFCRVYDYGLLIYPETNTTFADTFTQDLFVWYAITLGLVTDAEVAEMIAYVKTGFEECFPGMSEASGFHSLSISVTNFK